MHDSRRFDTCRCLPSASDAVNGSSTGPHDSVEGCEPKVVAGASAPASSLSRIQCGSPLLALRHKNCRRGGQCPQSMPQYSSASMIVMTRWVTEGSAGSGECIDRS